MVFYRFEGDNFEGIDWNAFLTVGHFFFQSQLVIDGLQRFEKLKKLNVIKPYHPNFLSTVTSIPRVFSQWRELKKTSRRYKMGHGDKAIYWYWEFDMEQKCYHEFLALNFEEAMKIYETEKFKMWEEDWVPPS
ncbi:hypothetical protein AN958_08370 [Leucoagaricus sp. SymC.cos]|nr:hypothetical protein AN958_08370 [Leucoagaricus sp. SymC.cos]